MLQHDAGAPSQKAATARTKFCRRCGQHKLHADFSKDRRLRDGLHTYCKACQRSLIVKCRPPGSKCTPSEVRTGREC